MPEQDLAPDLTPDLAQVTAAFEQLPTAYVVLTPDLVVVDANAAYRRLAGRARAALRGRPVFEAFPPTPASLDATGANPARLSLERARDTGLPDPVPLMRYDLRTADDAEPVERWWSLLSAPVHDAHGRVQLLLQRVEDLTDWVDPRSGEPEPALAAAAATDLLRRTRELRSALDAQDRNARRLASVNAVALELAAAETVEDLEQVVVQRGLAVLGADGGAIISPHEEGGWRATLSSLGEQVVVAYGHVPYDSPLPAPAVARTGERLLLPTRAAGLAYDASMADVYVDTGRQGWAFLPMVIGGACVGCLAVAWADEHPLAADELHLLEGFAAQCAQALGRIRATEEQRRAASLALSLSETLQRSLLTSPPRTEGLRTAVRYRPAAEQAQVGGDWYDAFVTASGATVLVVGDVTGHDRTAAATMGQVRNVLRGLAYDSLDSPAELLRRVDGAIRGLALDTLATAVLGRLEPAAGGGRHLRWSSAGHLPPLVRRSDGSTLVLDAQPDLLLGLEPGTSRTEQLVELAPGSTLVLYTDGLVERRDASLDDGIARLEASLVRWGHLEPERLSDLLLQDLAEEGHDDDIALLVVRVDGEPVPAPALDAGRRAAAVLPNHGTSVREARRLVRQVGGRAGLPDDVVDTAVLLTSEVVTNALLHGRSEARLTVEATGSALRVEVGDDNSRAPVRQEADAEALDGRGMTMVEALAADWGIRPEEGGKVVWLVVR